MSLFGGIAYRALRRRGYDLIPLGGVYAQDRRRALRDQEVTTVVDAGANDGEWAMSLRGGGYTGRIVSFEPSSEAFEALEARSADDPRWGAYKLALGAADGRMRLNVAGNSSSSSLLEMTERHVAAAPTSAYLRTDEVRVTRLDALGERLGLRATDSIMLKLDVQGYELEVLKGAGALRSAITVLEAELSLVELYERQPSLLEVVGTVRDLGLVLAAVEPVFADPRNGELLQLNGLFLRA